MKKILLLCCAMAVCAAPAAFADVNGGLDLTWNACAATGGVPTTTLDCAGGGAAPAFGTFFVTSVQDSVIAMDVALDLIVNNAGLPTFWHFEAGGCNELTGAAFSNTKPSLGCGSIAQVTPLWTPSGSGNALGFVPQTRGPNTGHFVGSVFRPSTSPGKCNASPSNYFGFAFTIITDNAQENTIGTCVGCPLGFNIVWNSANLINARAAQGAGIEAAPYPIAGPGNVGNCITGNGGAPGGCQATPARNRTWGQLKSLYR